MVLRQLGDEQVRLKGQGGHAAGGGLFLHSSFSLLSSILNVKVHQGSVELQIQL